AIGHVTLFKNISGSNNTALGAAAMQSSTAGDQNTSIGASSGLSNTGGNGNTFLGYQADAGSGDLVNASAIGSKARVCASNTMEFGNSQVSGWGFGTCPGANAILVGTNSSNGNGASLTEAGVWTNASSRSFKDRFHSLSGTEILSKIAALDVLGWYYKGTNEYHIGPVAEDFYSAFETGNQDDKEYSTKHISSVDPAGVALIGIKELKKENNELRNEISSLRKELDKIKAALKK
ncbi:MAG TPA: bZIP transcription factor, partial [Steroidobacteraceae bacterium]|nr:bZIP transcription factor [Steroidobacteraceae bacterium]